MDCVLRETISNTCHCLDMMNIDASHTKLSSTSLLPTSYYSVQDKEGWRWSTQYITPLLLMLQFFFANLTFLAKKIPQDTHYCNLAFTQVDAMPQFSV